MRIAAIVLAAGASSRFGSNKLAARFKGKSLLAHAIAAARAAPVDEVLVVARADTQIGDWAGMPEVRKVELASDELSASLKAGIAAAGDVAAAFVFLGDMPLVPLELGELLAASIGGHYAAVPRHEGRPGHPVLLSARAFADVARLEGDAGAGRLLRQREDVVFVEWGDARIHLDIDRKEDLERLSGDAAG